MPSANGPLHNIHVLDLATSRAELAGRLLADLGADVLKIEPPDGADARRLPPFDERAGHEGESLYWAAVALGKRSLVLDITKKSGRERLLELASDADVLIESFEPGYMLARGLGPGALAQRNPSLIYASVSPFGQSGPLAHAPATDLTIEASGGLVALQGDPDRVPIPTGYPQASFHAGAQAAADIVIALNERVRSGLGQHLDVSAQAAIVWTLMHATGFPPNTGANPPGTCEHRGETASPFPGLRHLTLGQCKDGWYLTSVLLPGIGGRTFDALMAWVAAETELDDDLRGVPWHSWASEVVAGNLTVDQVNRAQDAFAAFARDRSMLELQTFALKHKVVLGAIYAVKDLPRDPHLNARRYWTKVGGRLHPGPYIRLSATPARPMRPAPELNNACCSPEWQVRKPLPGAASQPGRQQAFAGLKVADFAWVGVGPLVAKALGDHGATVIHVESSLRPDVLRLAPPFKDNQAGIDRAQFMANYNSSKLGLALNLQTEQGKAIAHRLVDWADVVVESFTPGTMARLGLGYEELSRGRPDLIIVSTCRRGQRGPEAANSGFGSQGAALAGLHGLTGWPDRPPYGTWGAYSDFIAPRAGVAGLAAALYHRQRTGRGQHIDLSQVEAAMHFIEPVILDYTVNGREAIRHGLDSIYAAPHGVYRTRGKSRHIAIAAETREQWRALRDLASLDAFSARKFDRLEARIAARTEIDAALAPWCRRYDAFKLAGRLRAAGVPASAVQYPSDLYEDPQLTHRNFFVTLDHTVMGPTPYDGLVTQFSVTPGKLHKAAPCLGEDTEYVLKDILGMTEDEVAEAAAAEALV
jgi:crotonobetainyl-CoA:carnitine CoA-transferase CaiB-like acyl-CoA transferase